MQGDIYASSDGKVVTLSVTRNADADTLAAPDETPVVVPVVPAVTTAATKKEETKPIPAETDYVMNKNTKKFHYPSCKSVKQMKKKTRASTLVRATNLFQWAMIRVVTAIHKSKQKSKVWDTLLFAINIAFSL